MLYCPVRERPNNLFHYVKATLVICQPVNFLDAIFPCGGKGYANFFTIQMVMKWNIPYRGPPHPRELIDPAWQGPLHIYGLRGWELPNWLFCLPYIPSYTGLVAP